jgi:capsular polysaccharide transport system permease protein
MYVSESRFIVKSQGRESPQISSLANLIQTTGLSSGQEQTNEVISYIKSRNGLEDVLRDVNVRSIYGLKEVDAFSRFPAPFRKDRFESLYRYYTKMISARTDSESGLAVVAVKAFTPQDAQTVNMLLLRYSESLVNRLNEKARKKAISEAESRVREAEQRVRTARLTLTAFRNKYSLLDPAKQGAGVLQITDQMIAERAALQAQLELMVRVTPNNPAIPALRGRIAAIGGQIDIQSGRATGTSTGIASRLGRYEALSLEQEFAAQTLVAANASLEQARVEAVRQQFYLETVVQPNKPDLAEYPHRLTQIITISLGALFLYMIGWMLVVGILEHAPED